MISWEDQAVRKSVCGVGQKRHLFTNDVQGWEDGGILDARKWDVLEESPLHGSKISLHKAIRPEECVWGLSMSVFKKNVQSWEDGGIVDARKWHVLPLEHSSPQVSHQPHAYRPVQQQNRRRVSALAPSLPTPG
jgi:hypothetical protein